MPAQPHKAFKDYVPGFVHMDVKYLPQMQDEAKRRYLLVAIDRATRRVFVQVKGWVRGSENVLTISSASPQCLCWMRCEAR